MNLFAPGIETINVADLTDVARAFRFDGRRLTPTATLHPGSGYFIVAKRPTTITIRNRSFSISHGRPCTDRWKLHRRMNYHFQMIHEALGRK